MPPTGKQAAIEIAPQASAKWAAAIRQEKGKWTYEFQPSEMHFGASELTTSLGTEVNGARMVVKKVEMDASAKLRLTSSSLFTFDPRSFEAVDFKSSFKTGEGSFERAVAGKKTPGRFSSQESSFHAVQDKEIDIGFESVTNGLFAQAYLASRPSWK